MKRKALALVLACAMVFGLTACKSETGTDATTQGSNSTTAATQAPTQGSTQGSNDTTTAAPTEATTQAPVPAETVVIRYGTHWVNGLDPNKVDDVTGEYTMGEAERQAGLAGLRAIKEQLNVEFEFVQYAGDTRTELMTSVLAGNPVCDIAVLWNGSESTVLAQNILQKLDNYVGLFSDSEAAWLLDEQLFGHYYLLDNDMDYTPYFPLVVNLTLLEQVDALKDANGKMVYPMDLYEKGEWTWNKFKEILTAVNAYYSNVEAPDGAIYDTVQAYETDFRFAALAALYANGTGIYRNGDIAADSPEAIDAVDFIRELRDAKLLTDCGLYDDGYVPQWCRGGDDFGRGATVFSDVPNWSIGGYASSCADRGESIAILPWPRADRLAADSPDYKQVLDMGDSVGILKGVSEEKTELAIKAYILYWQTYYRTLGNVATVAEYKDAAAAEKLASYGVDLYNDEFGDSALACFQALAANLAGNPAKLLGIWENNDAAWAHLLGKSLTGAEGTGAYDVTIKANKDAMANLMSGIASNLASDTVHDNQAPSVSGETVIVPVGTEITDWTQYITAEDSVDGVLDVSKATVEVRTLDLDTVGVYDGAVKLIVADKSGNEGSTKLKVIVYNPDNKTAPTITPKDELPTVAVDTDASGINWSGDFIDKAEDADGLDIKSSVKADLSELDTTTAGTYNVVITVTDYAGNTAEITLEVTVAAK